MGLAELLALGTTLITQGARIYDLVEKCAKEKRDPTPEELADVKARQQTAEDRWASLAPKSGE